MFVDDDGFVRAPAELVYRRLTHVEAWPSWWPGIEVRRLPAELGPDAGPRAEPDDEPGECWAIELRGAPLRRVRLAARSHGWRHERGFSLALRGDVEGRAEFWLEPAHGGTVVHHVLIGRTDLARPLDVYRDYRRALRRGLWGLKDQLHLEVRTSVGLEP
jgi:uncharacterized protein YndB with AHSA1/START domain